MLDHGVDAFFHLGKIGEMPLLFVVFHSGEIQKMAFCNGGAPLPELMDRKKRDIMERKGDKEDENKRQKQQKESSAAAL